VKFPSTRNNLILDNGDWVIVHSTFYEGNVHRSLKNNRQLEAMIMYKR
jgi:hypothetical protein